MPGPFRALLALGLLLLGACATTLSDHPTAPAVLGAPVGEAMMLDSLSRPGVVTLEKTAVADWHFPNTVREPGAKDWRIRQLDAQIYVYSIVHPQFGPYLIDAGMPADYEAWFDPILKGVVRNDYSLKLRIGTEALVARWGPPKGVFVTHLHYDHILGIAALDADTPVYVGPHEGDQRSVFHLVTAPPVTKALKGRPPLNQWRFPPPAPGHLAAIDIFGDGSVFALHVPGHTPGSTAYLVNTPDGPQLITGDAFHSREAWTGQYEEATGFEADLPRIHQSQADLRALAARIPGLIIHPGHQSLLP